MTGSSVFDYIHHQDHSEMAEQLGLGLSQGQGLASPSSAASEETAATTATQNPDGEYGTIKESEGGTVGIEGSVDR